MTNFYFYVYNLIMEVDMETLETGTLNYVPKEFDPKPLSEWDKIKEDKTIKRDTYVQFVDGNKTYRGVVQHQEDDGRWEVHCTSRLIKKDNYYKLYESGLPIWSIPEHNLTKIECDCYRLESGYKWVECPDCHYNCYS